MRDDRDVRGAVLPAEPFEFIERSCLHVAERLTVRNRRHAALRVEPSPPFITTQRCKRLSAPLAKIDLVERIFQLHFELRHAREVQLKDAFNEIDFGEW